MVEPVAAASAIRAHPLEQAVHVWHAAVDSAASRSILGRHAAILDGDERARADRFHFAADRDTFVLAHALTRRVLSRHAPVAPGDWRFTVNRFGKPEIERPPSVAPLRFNLTHTRGLVACAVTLGRDVGVDAERRDRVRPADFADLAARYFSPEEAGALTALSDGERTARFVAYWTLKEAYVKARGGGLSIPLDSFTIRFDPSAGPRLVVDSPAPGSVDEWRLEVVDGGDAHTLAVATRHAGRVPPEIRVRRADLTVAGEGLTSVPCEVDLVEP